MTIATRDQFLAKRALQHLHGGLTDQADGLYAIDIAEYADPALYAREYQAIFMRKPQGLILSLELPDKGGFVARTIMGKPLLFTRDQDGVVRLFLNICRHRGAKLCKDMSGKASRFVCPYHSWSFDREGQLTGMYGKSSFGLADMSGMGLTQLACEERAGIIWGVLTPGVAFDIDAWLGDFRAELETLNLDNWHIFEQRDIPGPGWKITMDGYLDAYHHPSVHPGTLGLHTIGNLLVHDVFGPHQRLTIARHNLSELDDMPESNWDATAHLRHIHSIFPNMSISGILGDHCLVSQILPGKTHYQTITRQTILAAKQPETEEEIEKTRAFSEMARFAVAEEDYPVGYSIQEGLESGANTHFTIGRNEPAIQHYHHMVDAMMREK